MSKDRILIFPLAGELFVTCCFFVAFGALGLLLWLDSKDRGEYLQ